VLLESSNLGFTCCDWLPNRLSLQDEMLLMRIERLIGSDPIVFLRAREEFQRTVTFPGALYSDFPIRCVCSLASLSILSGSSPLA
jgi:hypothetical protein